MRKTIFRMVALLCISGTHMLSATAQTSDAVNATKLADSNSTFISESSHGEDDELQVVDNMPEFPGGNQALMAYLKNNIKYPTICQRQGIQGRVIIQFVINTDGSITNIQVVEPVNPHLDKEALRVVSDMPKWKPGSHEVSSYAYVLPYP